MMLKRFAAALLLTACTALCAEQEITVEDLKSMREGSSGEPEQTKPAEAVLVETKLTPEEQRKAEEEKKVQRKQALEKDIQELIRVMERSCLKLSCLPNREGNYAEAKELTSAALKALPANHPGGEVAVYWFNYCRALRSLEQEHEYDAMLKYVSEKFPQNLYFLTSLRSTYPRPDGYMINNQFRRGDIRGNAGRMVFCEERDRVQALQLMAAGIPAIEKSGNKNLKVEFYRNLSICLMRSGNESWKMQHLTDLSVLPDYTEQQTYSSISRPPVQPDGTPVYYSVPSSWDAAKNDGERMRWAFARCAETGGAKRLADLGRWLAGQFDFKSVNHQIRREYLSRDAYLEYLYGLKDNETMAELADGVRRLTLPEDQNYIRILKEAGAYHELAGIYAARAQFEKAAEYYRKSDENTAKRITGEYGSIKPFTVLSAGTAPRMEYTYRNAKSARIVIRKADTRKAVKKMLETMKTGKGNHHSAYDLAVKQVEGETDWSDCIGEIIADYTVPLTPKPHHWDNVEYMDLPLKEPGAYLVRVIPGNAEEHWVESLVWLTPVIMTSQGGFNNDTVQQFILSNPDGTPVSGAKVHMEKYCTYYAQNPEQIKAFGGKTKIKQETREYTSGKDGSFLVPVRDFRTEDRYGIHNTNSLMLLQDERNLTWMPVHFQYRYSRGNMDYERTFIITDRPIYKPGDTVKFTAYLRTPKYGTPLPLQDHAATATLRNPRYEQAEECTVKSVPGTDACTGEFKLPADAMLGTWSVYIPNGAVSFRVEEYKKPEYELTVSTPRKPVKLGEPFSIDIQGKYYFGAPMADAKVKYRIFREEAARVYPFFGRFDWLFGPGYLICSTARRAENEWHITFGREQVLSAEGKLDSAGKLSLTVNTAEALAKFGSHDYRYSVEAEISDSSNRVISGSGSVLAAARPFYVWLSLDCGYADTGKSFSIRTKALTGDNKDVAGKGVMKIYRRALNKDGVPARTGDPVKIIEFVPGAYSAPTFVMDIPGVYEAEAAVTAEDGTTETGVCTFYVCGEQKNSNLFSDEEFEITLDKGEYQPGETVRVLVTAKKPGRSIYFYRRSERKLDCEYVKLDGNSKVFEIKLNAEDQPNTFISLYAVAEGETYSLCKEIPIPPEQKMLNLNITVPEGKIRPRSVVPLKIAVTGLDGKPAAGAVTVAVYDKSLEALAASNIPALNSFFWNWRRYFSTNSDFSNLAYPLAQTFPRHVNGTERMLSMTNIMGIYFWKGYGGRGHFRLQKETARMRKSVRYLESTSNLPMMAAAERKIKMDMLGGSESVADMCEENADMEISDGNTANPVRKDFRDTAYWLGVKELGTDGTLTVDVPMPDDLTTWKVRVWSLTPDTRVGEGSAEIIVSKDLIARLELPRFLIQQDTVQAVANVHNYTDKPLTVNVNLSVSDPAVIAAQNLSREITVAPGKHTTEHFTLTAKNTGLAKLTLKAVSANGKDSDALERELPVLVKGISKQVNACGRLDENRRTAAVTLNVPEKRRSETTFLTLNLAPGAAKTMVELLPYLADDDSRDVFGVVSRFVPALSAEAALKKMNVKFADLNLAPGSRDKLYSEYMQLYVFGPQSFEKTKPSHDPATFRRVISDSRKMILGMVNTDGGWGWFSGHREYSYPDTTAFVLDALLTAKANGDKIPQSVLKRAAEWLFIHSQERVDEIRKRNSGVNNTDALVASVLKRARKPNAEFANLIYERRVPDLSPYGLAMLAFAYDKGSEQRVMLKRNLTQFLRRDSENGTAYLEIPDNMWFFWWGNENVTQATYLRLLIADDPKDPMAAELANYLVTNIRNSPWRNSPRTLGSAVQALAEYIMASGKNRIDLTATVKLDGEVLDQFKIDSKNMWQSEFTIATAPEQLPAGEHKLEIEMQGQGVLYFNSMLNYFSLEDKIEPAGLEMKIRRNYYKLVQDKDASVLAAGTKGSLQTLGVEKYQRVPLKDGDTIQPGDLVEVELISTAKNDYDYVVFADSMPAGFEYVNPVSGYIWDWRTPVYCEYRERGARFYLRNMARGDSNVFYRIRAQLPGTFTSLPATGKGVYAPALNSNSTQLQFRIKDSAE